MWKARSQAAYQGYSHLSGIEMTSRLWTCDASPVLRPLAPAPRVGAGRNRDRPRASRSRRSSRTAWTTAVPRSAWRITFAALGPRSRLRNASRRRTRQASRNRPLARRPSPKQIVLHRIPGVLRRNGCSSRTAAGARRATAAGPMVEPVVRRGFGADLGCGVHRVGPAMDDVLVECVLDVRAKRVRSVPVEPLRVRLVLREQDSGTSRRLQ